MLGTVVARSITHMLMIYAAILVLLFLYGLSTNGISFDQSPCALLNDATA